MKINEINFVDLYLGDSFCDITGLDGAGHRQPAPASLADEFDILRMKCKRICEAEGEAEFSLLIDNTIYRGTALEDVTNKDVFILRRSAASILPVQTIGFSSMVLNELLKKEMKGLILFAGEMGAGKTSTLASVLKARLVQHGGIAIAIEDPPETNLNGLHGEGRCIQIRASHKNGGYKEQMRRAMRSGADTIMVGEIRDNEPAMEAAKGAINGHLLMATIHSGNPIEAIERLQTFCNSAGTTNTNEILADGLAMVIWQTLERIKMPDTQQQTGKNVARIRSSFLIVRDKVSVKTKIRKGALDQLIHDISEQSTQMTWNTVNDRNDKGARS
jgi:twitching motility protein PilT